MLWNRATAGTSICCVIKYSWARGIFGFCFGLRAVNVQNSLCTVHWFQRKLNSRIFWEEVSIEAEAHPKLPTSKTCSVSCCFKLMGLWTRASQWMFLLTRFKRNLSSPEVPIELKSSHLKEIASIFEKCLDVEGCSLCSVGASVFVCVFLYFSLLHSNWAVRWRSILSAKCCWGSEIYSRAGPQYSVENIFQSPSWLQANLRKKILVYSTRSPVWHS